MTFNKELEELSGVVFGSVKGERSLVDTDVDEPTCQWTEETSVYWLGSILDGLMEDFDEEEAVAALEWLIAEAYKFSHWLEPKDKDISGDIGTVDQPPSSYKRGRIAASGMTPTQEEALRRVVAMLSDRPPKTVKDAKIEDSVEIWKEAAGKLINQGKGVIFKVDKKTNIPVVEPDYHLVYTTWKDMVDKVVGFRPTRQMEQKMEKSIDKARSDAARTLAKMRTSGKVSPEAAKQASTLMRGARGR